MPDTVPDDLPHVGQPPRILDDLALEVRSKKRMMPFWYIGSLLLTAWLAAAKWGGPAGDAAVAAAPLVVSVVMSVTLLVPIANRSATWTADYHPADWREQQQRWDRLHYARVAIIVAAFVLTLIAGTAD